MRDRPALLAWLGALGLIAWASLSPPESPGGPGQGSWMTSIGHVPAYALLTAITLRLAQGRSGSGPRIALVAASVALGIGAFFECVQPLVGRDGNLTDMALDAVGVGAAVIAWSYGWLPKRHVISR